MEIVAPPQTPAEANCRAIEAMARVVHKDMLKLGELLWENQEGGYWGEQAESFRDFVQQCGLSYDWCTRAVDLIRQIKAGVLTEDYVLQIGVGKAVLLLPQAKKGNLTDEIKAVAENGSWNDLRQELGHNLTEQGKGEIREFVHCPRCGQEFQLMPGMIERR